MSTDNRPPSYPLRLEPDLREKIESLAKANGRSLNAQLVWMLESYLDSGMAEIESPTGNTKEELRQIARQVFEEEVRAMVQEKLEADHGIDKKK